MGADGGLSTCVLPEEEESLLQGWVPSLGSEHGGGVGQGNIGLREDGADLGKGLESSLAE